MSGQNSDDGQHYTEAVGTRLSPQTKEKFDEYREANELSNSEALRRLLRSSLEQDRHTSLSGAGVLAGTSWAVFVALGADTAAVVTGGLFIMYGLVWSVYPQLRGYLS
jgi:hypothetical protein